MTKSDSEEHSTKSKWELTKEIIKDICLQNNGRITINKVKEEFEKRHPGKKSRDVSDNIRMMTVNSQSRLSYLQFYGRVNPGKNLNHSSIKNSEGIIDRKREYPRISSPENEKDFLFHDSVNNQYEIYEPSKHGVWEIFLDADDVNHLCRIEDVANKYKLIFDSQVRLSFESSSDSRLARLAESESIPERQTVTTSIFKRNPDVVAEILFRAMGICEDCRNKAPFDRKSDGEPYLEVHHIIPLCEGGYDNVKNSIALCPNCHRKRHFG
jgi:5-methylcytosine-specific restriction protein A